MFCRSSIALNAAVVRCIWPATRPDRSAIPQATGRVFPKRDVVEFVFDGAMEFGVVREATHHPVEDVNEQTGGALADAVGLRTVGFGSRVVHVLDRQIKLIGMVFDLAAIFGAAIRQDRAAGLFMRGKERDHAVVQQVGVSETLCMRASPCVFGGSLIEPFWE